MSTFITMLVCARPDVVAKAAIKTLGELHHRRDVSQALVREPITSGLSALLYVVGPEVDMRSEKLGIAFELFDDEEGEGWLHKVAAGIPNETWFALLYTDMYQFEKAWKFSAAGWQSCSMIGDHAERASSDGQPESGEEDPMEFLAAATGLSRETLLGVGYDEEHSAVAWRHIGEQGATSSFARWLDELPQLQLAAPSWSEVVAQVTGEKQAVIAALRTSVELAKTSREAAAAGDRIVERARQAGHIKPASGPRRIHRVADGLFETSGTIAKLAIVCSPAAVAEVLPWFDDMMAIGLGEIPAEPTVEDGMLALLGVVAYGHVMACCGRKPPTMAIEREREWIGKLVRILPASLARFGAFAAIAAGACELVHADAHPFARRLADAMARGTPAADLRGELVEFVRAFPAHLTARELGWFELTCVARAYFVQLEHQPLPHAAQLIHELVDFVTRGIAQPGGVVHLPPRQAPPRPRRIAAPSQGVLKRLFAKTDTWRLELHDVHAMWGGLRAFLMSDGDVWAEQVDRGVAVARLYRGALSPTELQELAALRANHDLRTIKIAARPGVGGEGTTTVSLVTPRGTVSVSKWANDKHPELEAFVARLRAFAETVIRTSAPIWHGPFDHSWTP